MQLVDCARSNTVMPNWRSGELMGSLETTPAVNELAGVQVYPNPTDGLLTIVSENEQEYQVKITDLQGRLILERSFAEGKEQQLNLSGLPASVYLLEIKSEQGVLRKKLIKTN